MLTPATRRAMGVLAARRHGVVTREELLAIGISRHAITWAVRTGVLLRLYPGVYAINGAPDTWRLRAMAAQRRVERHLRRKDPIDQQPPVVAVGGPSAAHLHGLPGFGRAPRIVVSTSRRCRSRLVETSTSHALEQGDVVEVDGIPTTGLAWTLLDVATTASRSQVEDLVVHVLGRERLAASELRAACERAEGLTGRHVVLDLVETMTDRHRSLAEKRLADACLARGLPRPDANRVVTTSSEATFELDLYWDDVHLDVEVDGPHHLLVEQRVRDRRRDRLLEDDGIEVVRFDVREVDADADDVARRIERKRRHLHG